MIVVLVIFMVGILVGGVFYFLGTQKAATSSTTSTTQTTQTTVSAGADDATLEKEIEATDPGSTDTDFSDIDKDTSSL